MVRVTNGVLVVDVQRSTTASVEAGGGWGGRLPLVKGWRDPKNKSRTGTGP